MSWTSRYEYPTNKEVMQIDYEDLKGFLEERYHLQGHPKADLLYRLAYEEGHAYGRYEITMYYVMMAELLDPKEKE